jgi:hypothetical protein
MTNFEAVVQYYFPGQEEFILGKVMASFVSDILASERITNCCWRGGWQSRSLTSTLK